MLAAIIVLVVVGIPTLAICAGVGFFAYFVSSKVKEEQAKQEARFQEDIANAGIPYEEKKVTNVQEAIDALNSNDWQHQRSGAEWLSRNPVDSSRRAAAAQALEKQVASIHGDVAENSLKALGTWGSKENAPAVARAMKDRRLDRRKASEQLGKWKNPSVAAELAELLDDSGPDGEAAAAALAEIGPQAQAAVGAWLDPSKRNAFARAERLLAGYGVDVQDATISARLATIKTRDHFRTQDALKALATMPLKPERQAEVARELDSLVAANEHRDEAVKALLVWGDKESVPGLVTFVKNETFVNKTAVQVLGKLKDPRAVEALVALLSNHFANDDDLKNALVAFGADAEKGVLPYMNDPALGDRTKNRARAVLTALGTKPEVMLTQSLTDLSSSEDRQVQSALEWLSKVTIDTSRQAEVANKLGPAVKGLRPHMQTPALEVLVKCNAPATTIALVELILDKGTQRRVVDALKKAGPASEDVLLSLLEHPDTNVVAFGAMGLFDNGTEKSVKPLQAVLRKAGTAKNQPLINTSRAAIDAIQKRTGTTTAN